jgi:oligopeptide transport system ATP-binding protein
LTVAGRCGRLPSNPFFRDLSLSASLLRVHDLQTVFHTSGGVVQAVRGVKFEINRGETVGIVGESGSGKSVTALSLMRLVPSPPGEIIAGSVELEGRDLLRIPIRDMREVRGGRISMIFQDPFSSLNPTMTLGEQVAEAICAHTNIAKWRARDKALELFRAVRIPSPELRLKQYPHQISGGQRQRVMIALAFSTNPTLLIADEPTTALDVTVQAQIMSLMDDFQKRTDSAILLITHDLGIVAEMCDRVLVMYAGRIVDEGTVEQIFRSPKHPYTVGLLESLPQLNADARQRLKSIPGQPPNLAQLPPGCPFADRCPKAMEVCGRVDPEVTELEEGQKTRCHLYGEGTDNG